MAVPVAPVTALKGLLESWITTETLSVEEKLAEFKRNRSSPVEHGTVNCSIAACLGDLTKESVKTIDKELLLMLAAGLKKVNEVSKDPAPQWIDIVAALKNCSALEEVQEEHVYADDSKLFSDTTSLLKVEASTDPAAAAVEAFKKWFKSHVSDVHGKQDDHVLQTANFTDAVLAQLGGIVAQTVARADSFADALIHSEYQERTVLDIGIIHFPDSTNDYLKIYRILVKVWRSSKKEILVLTEKSGAKLVFECSRFKPRAKLMAEVSPETFVKAAKTIEEIFP